MSAREGDVKAMVINRFGGPEVFEPFEVPRPSPGPGEVLIKVAASSVNPVDYKVRCGRGAFLCPTFPAILHADCAGHVAEVGPGVTAFAEGDGVYAFATGLGGKPGALADYMLADSEMVAKAPTSIPLVEAAALPLVAVTTWYALYDYADIGPKQSLLVMGGTGGVGHVAVQMAKARGAYVVAVSGGADKCALAKGLGADAVIDYRTAAPDDYAGFARSVGGFDFVFNTPGAASINAAVKAASFGGTILDILGQFPTEYGFQLKWLNFKSVFAATPIVDGTEKARVGHILAEVASLVDDAKLRPLIDERRFGFSEVGAAHEVAEHNSPTGKVLLTHDLS
ncbi:MAG: zinc-binding dehydrogenase [Pseudomonadota bacterium]